MPDAEERGFLAALKEDAKDVTTRLAYADWLEEHERKYEAVLQRVKAGVSEARFKIRRKSDGMLADGRGGWSNKGKEWRRLADVRTVFHHNRGRPRYYGVDWEELEVVVLEIRVQTAAALPVRRTSQSNNVVSIDEPRGTATD
jgi:uncharacterized protein (TIGR02996 family)